MSLTRDRKQIRAELARLKAAEVRVRREFAFLAAAIVLGSILLAGLAILLQ